MRDEIWSCEKDCADGGMEASVLKTKHGLLCYTEKARSHAGRPRASEGGENLADTANGDEMIAACFGDI